MADATTINTMQLTSANNQPNSDSEDASSLGTDGVRPMFQQIQTSLRNVSLGAEWASINGLTSASWTSTLTPTHVSGTSFTYQGDQTLYFTVNRRLKALLAASTIYGYVSSSSFSAGPNTTTVVAVWDSGSLDATETDVQVASLNPSFLSIPTQVIATKFSGATSGTNTYTVTLLPAPATLAALQNFAITLLVASGNTGNVTLAPNGLAATAVKKWSNGSLVQLLSGDIQANATIIVMYDGTQFQLVSIANQIPQFDGPYSVRNLVGSSAGGSTQYTLTATLLALRPSPTNASLTLPGFSGGSTLDISTAGPALNGRDQAGAFGAAATIHIFAIRAPGQTTGLLASSSATAPTLPTNYTNFAYLFTAILTGGNFFKSYVRGNKFHYAANQVIVSAVTPGGSTSQSYTAFVPALALDAIVLLSVAASASGGAGASTLGRFGISASADGPQLNTATPLTANFVAGDDLEVIWPNTGSIFYQCVNNAGAGTSTLSAYILGYTVPNNA